MDAECNSNEATRSATGLLAGRAGARINRLVDSWLLWLTVGALTGVVKLSPTLNRSADVLPPRQPSAVEIEQAVADAEVKGIEAGAPIRKPAR